MLNIPSCLLIRIQWVIPRTLVVHPQNNALYESDSKLTRIPKCVLYVNGTDLWVNEMERFVDKMKTDSIFIHFNLKYFLYDVSKLQWSFLKPLVHVITVIMQSFNILFVVVSSKYINFNMAAQWTCSHQHDHNLHCSLSSIHYSQQLGYGKVLFIMLKKYRQTIV